MKRHVDHPRTSLLHEGLEHELKFGALLSSYRGLWFVRLHTLWSIGHGSLMCADKSKSKGQPAHSPSRGIILFFGEYSRKGKGSWEKIKNKKIKRKDESQIFVEEQKSRVFILSIIKDIFGNNFLKRFSKIVLKNGF